MVVRRLCALVLLVSIAFTISCGDGSPTPPPPQQNNPVPSISSLSPASANAGGSAFTLTVSGTNFVSTSTVQWNGSNRTTTYVSASQLTASIAASDIAAGGTSNVTVVNPSPGGGASQAVAFSSNNPLPTVTTISPNSSEQESATFTLSIVGSNFTSGSEVSWNGVPVANTTFINNNLLTVQMPADATTTAGTDSVAVVNPSPGGGTSNTAGFSVPCPIPASTAASAQTHARLGAYYFDGWSMALTNFHFQGLPFGPFQGREPLTGWQDNTNCSVERQLAWAHSFGIDFFVFDWYFNSEAVESGDNLNSALEITHALNDRHGMQFAILYVDSGSFTVQPADWNTAVGQWIGYMRDPSYTTVAGKPLLVVYDMNQMRTTFGSSANVAAAFNQLRAAAQSAGLPGVYIMGAISAGYDHNTQSGVFPDLSAPVADGYDGFTLYNWAWYGTVSGQQPFSILAEAGQWIWSQASLKSPLPFIPVSMAGWDPRPWNEGNIWFTRTPQDVTGLLDSAIKWTAQNPTLRPESSPNPPIIFIEAWNEFGEGSHMLPTVEDQTAYGDALAQYLSGP